jgi:hypothetical protein
MSSALSSPFMADSISEVVPDVVKVAGKLAMSSVITGRRRVRLVPQSGQNYTSGASSGVINILIQDGQAYADLLSACLSFQVTTYDSANGVANGTAPPANKTCVLDDGAYSVFRRALISVNSTLMDDIDFLPKKVNAELYATASQAWYNTVGSFMGLWKHNSNTIIPTTVAGATSDAVVSKYDIATKANLQARKVQGSGVGATSAATATAPYQPGQNQFSVPLSLLTSFFRNDTLFPSRNAGQLYVQLNLASAVESMLASYTTTPNVSYAISNLTLELDFVDLHPTYLSLMDDLIETPGGSGVNWAFDAHLCSSQSIGGSSGQKSVIVSKASQNMRSLQVVAQPSAALASTSWLAQSTFQNPGAIDIQYRIGSLYYPAFTAVGEHRMYMDLQNSFGSPESVDKSGIIDNNNYYTSTPDTFYTGAGAGNLVIAGAGGANSVPLPNQNNQGTLVASTIPRSAWSDCWSYGYCFDRLKHAKFHGVELDGINTLTSAGSQMVVQINCNPASPSGPANPDTTLTSIVRFTRVLHLGAGATSVIG